TAATPATSTPRLANRAVTPRSAGRRRPTHLRLQGVEVMARDIVFILITLVLFALWGVPNLRVFLTLLFPGKVRSKFEEGENTIQADDYPESTQQLIGNLTELGFQPLGIKHEQRPLQAAKDLSYASAESKSFASVHGFEGQSPHYYFYTPF